MGMNVSTGVVSSDAPTCRECAFGNITLVGFQDRCNNKNNVDGLHPVALRNDENLCGQSGAWAELRLTPVEAP